MLNTLAGLYRPTQMISSRMLTEAIAVHAMWRCTIVSILGCRAMTVNLQTHFERLFDIAQQVLRILDPRGVAYQTITNA